MIGAKLDEEGEMIVAVQDAGPTKQEKGFTETVYMNALQK